MRDKSKHQLNIPCVSLSFDIPQNQHYNLSFSLAALINSYGFGGQDRQSEPHRDGSIVSTLYDGRDHDFILFQAYSSSTQYRALVKMVGAHEDCFAPLMSQLESLSKVKGKQVIHVLRERLQGRESLVNQEDLQEHSCRHEDPSN